MAKMSWRHLWPHNGCFLGEVLDMEDLAAESERQSFMGKFMTLTLPLFLLRIAASLKIVCGSSNITELYAESLRIAACSAIIYFCVRFIRSNDLSRNRDRYHVCQIIVLSIFPIVNALTSDATMVNTPSIWIGLGRRVTAGTHLAIMNRFAYGYSSVRKNMRILVLTIPGLLVFLVQGAALRHHDEWQNSDNRWQLEFVFAAGISILLVVCFLWWQWRSRFTSVTTLQKGQPPSSLENADLHTVVFGRPTQDKTVGMSENSWRLIEDEEQQVKATGGLHEPLSVDSKLDPSLDSASSEATSFTRVDSKLAPTVSLESTSSVAASSTLPHHSHHLQQPFHTRGSSSFSSSSSAAEDLKDDSLASTPGLTRPKATTTDNQSLAGCTEALEREWSNGSWLVQFLSQARSLPAHINLALEVLQERFPALVDCAIPQIRENVLGRTNTEDGSLASEDAPDGTQVRGGDGLRGGVWRPGMDPGARPAFMFVDDETISTPGNSHGGLPSEISWDAMTVLDAVDFDDFPDAEPALLIQAQTVD